MKIPSCVLWGLTRKHSAFKVQPNGSKSRLDCFSSDPMNLTNLHNQSAQGFTSASGVGLQCAKEESKSKKSFRRVYHLRVGHKSYHNGKKTVLKNQWKQSRLVASDIAIKKDTVRAAKTIKGLTFVSDKKRQLLLQRLGRLHAAFRVVGGGAAAKK